MSYNHVEKVLSLQFQELATFILKCTSHRPVHLQENFNHHQLPVNESPSTPSNTTHPVLYTNSNTEPISSIILQTSSASNTLFVHLLAEIHLH